MIRHLLPRLILFSITLPVVALGNLLGALAFLATHAVLTGWSSAGDAMAWLYSPLPKRPLVDTLGTVPSHQEGQYKPDPYV